MLKKNALLIFIFLLMSTLLTAAEPAWELALDSEGIQVHKRFVPGCPLNEFKGTTTINASMQTISAVLRDVNNQSQWMADCLQSKQLKFITPDHLVVYNILHGTWPLSDRDLIIDVTFNENQKTKKLIVEMSVYNNDIIPVDKKYVRIRDFKASCIVEEISAGQCRVYYQNRVNPMAPVPDFVGNTVVKKNPFNTLKGMRKMVTLQKYQIPGK